MKIRIKNLQLNVTINNPNDCQKTLIWMHGLTDKIGANILNDTISVHEVAKHCRLIQFDARSHGNSDDDCDHSHHTWPVIAEDMLAVADYFKIDKFIAGGSSMGAASALWALTLVPQRVEGLILSIPPNGWEMRSESTTYFKKIANIIEHKGISTIIDAMLNEPVHPILKDHSNQQIARLKAFAEHPDDALKAIFLGAAASNFPTIEQLSKFNTPALILAWQDLPGHPVAIAERLNTTLPNSTLHVAHDYKQAYSQTHLINDFLAPYVDDSKNT